MYLHKTFEIPLYKVKVKFFIVDSVPRKVKQIEKIQKEKVVDYDYKDSGGAEFSFDVDTYYVIIRSDCIQHFYISHELQHFIDEITEDRGLVESEQRAYISGHITQEIHNFLKLKGINVE